MSDIDPLQNALEEWRSYVQPLQDLGARMVALMDDPHDRQLRLEMYRQVFCGLTMGYMGLFLGDPRHPDFWPQLNMVNNFGSPNPDGTYYLAPIEPEGVYKICGYRGSIRIADMAVCGGLFYPRGEPPFSITYDSYNLDDHLELGPDGWFEVILSQQKPASWQGNWWKLDARATCLMVRQFAYDWLKEVDGRFAIERLDTPATKPRMDEEKLDAELRQLVRWSETWTSLCTGWAARLYKEGYVNRVVVRDLAAVGGLTAKQMYHEGIFELAPDEVLVYEAEVPRQCRYWGIMLNDMKWSSIEYMSRQTSLNGHTAHVDGDGRFRAVISATDPGVPNWLDTAAYPRGTFAVRWNECSSTPEPTLIKMKLAELRQRLPGDTPTVSAGQRAEALRQRMRGAQLRRRW